MNREKTLKYAEGLLRERGITASDKKKEEMVSALMFNDDDMKSVMDHLESIPKPEPGENPLIDHYNEKDKKGNLKHDLWADLKSMNTNKKGECKCIQRDIVYNYDDSGCNVCPECMEDMF